MAQKLYLEYEQNNDPKKVKIVTVANPKEGITKAEATAVMQKFVDKKVYDEVTGVHDAYLKETVVTPLA
ncbi:MAG: DUF2922 domain-containing protein [Anaerovibrio sp.]|uniref:DUF2922 domain-containing protein n=1 Tax=Anaerovibrio sp. TaxID=1872532 RepID=UPI0025C30DA8|nr:DUF2922 domain-containing protein [Anaerovibrio sp.]MBE6099460.1 DUF2922 domain-containing protein [Anaerovibrio sp.]